MGHNSINSLNTSPLAMDTFTRHTANSTDIQCDYFTATIERQIQNEAGFFGIGADHAKIRDLRSRRNPACEQLKAWGVSRAQSQNFY